MLRRADISARAATSISLEGRYSQIAEAISHQTGFIPKADIVKSSWWGKKIGAVIYNGVFKVDGINTPAVLKIEAVETKPDEITEAAMIRKAAKALAGSGIRPPKVYYEIPWTTKHKGYSAIIMEDAYGTPVLPVPGTEENIAAIYKVRNRYRNALKSNKVAPWVSLDFPEDVDYLPHFVRTKFGLWKKSSKEIFPDHQFRKPHDETLIDRAVGVLVTGYKGVAPQFQHGHFSHRDVVTSRNEIILFSNLYWSWRAPFYDVVFPYHWYMYELANIPGITVEKIKEQAEIWDRQFDNLTKRLSSEDKRLSVLARIERLAAGLTIDALSISQDPQNDIVRYAVNKTRDELRQLLDHG